MQLPFYRWPLETNKQQMHQDGPTQRCHGRDLTGRVYEQCTLPAASGGVSEVKEETSILVEENSLLKVSQRSLKPSWL